MNDITLDVSELDKLAKDLSKLDEPKRKEATAAAQRVGAQVASRAKAAAPRDRPWLATRGIHRKTWKPRDGVHVDVFTGMDERGVNVGFYVEYGTSDTPPQPFLTPQTGWAAQELERELTEIVDPFKAGTVTETGDD